MILKINTILSVSISNSVEEKDRTIASKVVKERAVVHVWFGGSKLICLQQEISIMVNIGNFKVFVLIPLWNTLQWHYCSM